MSERVSVTLVKDTMLFQKNLGESCVYRANAYLPGGSIVGTGDYTQIETLDYDHQPHDFVPLEGKPEGDDRLLYLRTCDLPADW